jgi:uridine phosphorylase
MPLRLRPTAPLAADAVLVGDPGRALLLAQELLAQPKMSNHARGLWGYSGETAAGRALTIQSTGMGGPSAALVLADLAELGVRRAVRVGTCTALDPELRPGALVAIAEAHAWGGGGGGRAAHPDEALAARLRDQLMGSGELALGTRGPGGGATVASLDTVRSGGASPLVAAGEVADMQTATLFARAAELEVAAAAVLIVVEGAGGESLEDEALETAAKRGGIAAAAALACAGPLPNSKVEG